MTLELTDREAELIRELIDLRVDELGPEIHHTDSPSYREMLKETRDILRTVQGRFPATATSAAE